MEGIKKQPKAMFYLPGIIAICLGLAALGIETPDRTIRFGADFYTETYQAIAEVSHVIKTVAAYFLFALGAISLGKGMTEAKRSDLMLEELGAIRMALEESKSRETTAAPTEAAPEVPEALADVADGTTPVGPRDAASVEFEVAATEEQQETSASESADQVDADSDEEQVSE